jgi:hypothetical protein
LSSVAGHPVPAAQAGSRLSRQLVAIGAVQ